MPEKTLKEKVERAKQHISAMKEEMGALWWMAEEIEEALTALEEKVAELEKERAFDKAVSKIARGRDLEPWEEEIVHAYYERKYNKEAPDGK